LPQTVKRDSAEFVMTRLYESFNRIFGKDMVLSIGISGFPEDGDNAETLIKRALARD
jgi:GGDEF domain-containing protein